MSPELTKRLRRFRPRLGALLGSYVCVAMVMTAQTKDSQQSLASQSLGQISGHVYRSDTSEAIPRAQVGLLATDQSTAKAAGGERIMRTGGDGAFLFADVPAGTYQLEAWRNGFTEVSSGRAERVAHDPDLARVVSLKAGQKLDNLTIRLHPAGVIAGRISDEERESVSGLEVYALFVKFVRGGRRQINAMGRSVTDDLGNFRIANLPPGPYYVRAGGLIARPLAEVGLKEGPAGGMQYRNTFYPGTSSLDEAQPMYVRPEGSNDLQFTVPTERTFTITGKVLAKSPLERAEEVRYVARDTEGYMFSSEADFAQIEPDGTFKTLPLPPEDYTLSAQVIRRGVQTELGYASVRIVDSNVHADVEIGRGIEVRGKVEGPQAFPLQGTEIALQTFGPGFYFLHEAAVDSSVRFVIPNIPPGENMFTLLDTGQQKLGYIKKAVCNGQDYATSVFTLALGTSLDCAVTLANDMGVIHGKVMNGDNPAPKVVVVLIPESRELRRIPRYTLTSKTDAAGEYRISGVIPGDYLLFAVPPSPDNRHFALDFADEHRASAERISLNTPGVQAVDLKLTNLE